MSNAKRKPYSKRKPARPRAAREAVTPYKAQMPDALKGSSRTRSKKMVREIRGGKLYEYYPLGKFVVIAPAVAGKAPIFKYTRIRAKRALDLIGDGATIDEVAQKFDNAFVPPAAIQEALELARQAFAKAHPSLRKVKRIV